jgi:hypothetical protein
MLVAMRKMTISVSRVEIVLSVESEMKVRECR